MVPYMNNHTPATIMVIAPMKRNDATEYTYQWAIKAIRMAKSFGYKVIELHKDNVTYDNVTQMIEKYKPRLFMSFSHGCPTSLQGQKECVVTRRFGVEELVAMDREQLSHILEPLKSSCPGICEIKSNPCENMCLKDTNVHKLKDTIVYAVACHSASQLGQCSIRYGVETYIGYQDLLLFPVDNMKSEDIFGNVHLLFIEKLLSGHTVQDSINAMVDMEDAYIRYYKGTKYLALPMLWDKMNLRVLGNPDATIY